MRCNSIVSSKLKVSVHLHINNGLPLKKVTLKDYKLLLNIDIVF